MTLPKVDAAPRAVAFARDGLLAAYSDGTALHWRLAPKAPNGDVWEALAGDAETAYAALHAADAGIAPRLKLDPPDPKRVATLLGDLAADAIDTRERAARELEALGPAVEPDLRKAAGDPDLRERVQPLLDALDHPLIKAPDWLRRHRAIAALERLGAVDALKAIAESSPSSRERREAEAALRRR
jgi:hypothetical protein